MPALGWSSWNDFGCEINADKIMTAAKQMVDLGLKDRGYQYVNSEDIAKPLLFMLMLVQLMTAGLSNPAETLLPIALFRIRRNSQTVFPGSRARSTTWGLRLGYTAVCCSRKYRACKLMIPGAGETTCAGYPASLGYEEIDARSFAEWGIDCMFWTKAPTKVDTDIPQI